MNIIKCNIIYNMKDLVTFVNEAKHVMSEEQLKTVKDILPDYMDCRLNKVGSIVIEYTDKSKMPKHTGTSSYNWHKNDPLYFVLNYSGRKVVLRARRGNQAYPLNRNQKSGEFGFDDFEDAVAYLDDYLKKK